MTDIFRVSLDERVTQVQDEGWDLVVQQDNFAVLDRVHPRRWFRPWHRYERMFLHAAPTYLVERRWFTSRGRRV